MSAKIKRIDIPKDRRTICISDIHGNLELLQLLLTKISYSSDDILILLGDIYTKGKQNHETLKFIISLSQNPDVHVTRGNCDWIEDYLSEDEKDWLINLPHIIESGDYIFVHGGLTSGNLSEEDENACMKNDAFMEQGLKFDKCIITGHWPTVNYAHKIPNYNPIINEESRIIAIDGGNVVKNSGQLNAFFISDNQFSYDFADSLPVCQIKKPQAEKGGNLNITWRDRCVELVEKGEEFSTYRHIQSGQIISLANSLIWTDSDGQLCETRAGTDYYLPVRAGDTVSVIYTFSNKIYAKKNGIAGWIEV